MDPEKPRRIALIDGNSFYCSCERALNPALEGKPLIVLSNNDGCAIARTPEAKALGIPMGAPWFRLRSLAQSHGLIALSANFDLYGDLSSRMMNVIGQFSPRQEIYSIDESFLDLTGLPDTGRALGTALRQRVLQWTGIPTCVGVGATKTLAKLANHLAKRLPRLQGICDLSGLQGQPLMQAIRHVPVHEVWGVGRRLATRLQALDICTAADLARADKHMLQQKFSVTLVRTAHELQGTPCLALEDTPAPRQQILCSRSFGRPVYLQTHLAQALSTFTARAAEKLRQQESCTQTIQVFIQTSPHRAGPQYSGSAIAQLASPVDCSQKLTRAVLATLDRLYRPGYNYARAGVCLLDLARATAAHRQGELFEQAHAFASAPPAHRPLMQTIDALNQRLGRDHIRLASTLAEPASPWKMRQQSVTPAYTSRWSQVPVAHAQ